MGNQVKKKYRNINGVFLLDKPVGLSSNHALQKVKRLFQAKKAGHTGSLDPLASGMLPLCFGEATKFSQFLLESDKFYRVEFKLGETTATGDAEGEVIESKPVNVDEALLRATLKNFVGQIPQVPSMYSALKYQGQPLYKLARQGIEVPRPERIVSIYSIELLSFDGTFVGMDVSCSKGTYIRTLAEDIGKVLGCGAHVTTLRRLASGPYQAEQMITFEQLELLADDAQALENLLLPIETLAESCPNINLTSLTSFYVRRGQPVLIPHSPLDGWVKLTSPEGLFLGMGIVLEDGRIAPKRLISDTSKTQNAVA